MDGNVITVKQKLTDAEQLAIKEQLENVGLRMNLIQQKGDVDCIGRVVQVRFSKKDDEHTVWVRYTGDTQKLEVIPEEQLVGFKFGPPPERPKDVKAWALTNDQQSVGAKARKKTSSKRMAQLNKE